MTTPDSERLDVLEERLSRISGAVYVVLSDIRADLDVLRGSVENRLSLAEGILQACGVPLAEVTADLDDDPPRPPLERVK